MNQCPTETPAAAPPAPRGPLPGCIIISIGVLVFASLITFSIWTGIRQNQAIDEFTDENPDKLPVERLEENAAAGLDAGLRALGNAARAGTAAELRLDAAQLNHLIATDPALAELRGQLHIERISGSTISCRMSYPMNTLPWSNTRRFLNARLELRPELSEGEPVLRVAAITVPGRDLPAWFRDYFSIYQPLERTIRDDRFAPYIRQLSSFDLADGRLVVRTKNWKEPEPHTRR